MSAGFGRFLTPRDLTVIAHVLTKAVRHETDMVKRKEIIGVLTKLLCSKRRRRCARKAVA